ncbi:2-iminoacetate synthase ThiH [Caldicellulosiruptoraceae bacterium PP1]
MKSSLNTFDINTISYLIDFFESYKDYTLTKDEFLKIVNKENLDLLDLVKLINIDNNEYILALGQESQKITNMYFGRSILLYSPLYISNYCCNLCTYCGFSPLNFKGKREKLSIEQIKEEMLAIKETGIDSIIILTGEDRTHSPFDFISEAVKIAANIFSEVSIEVYPLSEEEYRSLVGNGLIGITIYQETYIEEDYQKLHLRGPKTNFLYRLQTPERAINAGVKEVSIGALLGLSNHKIDAYLTVLHAKYLQDKYPKCEISISFPRFKKENINFNSKFNCSDKELLKYIFIARVFLKSVGINISTREKSTLRDALIGYGVTKMSAGSKTTVGGYTKDSKNTKTPQFEVEDTRGVDSIVQVIQNKGFRVDFTNWLKGALINE